MGGKKKKICKEGNRVKPIDSGSIIEAVNQTKPSGALSTAGVVLVQEHDSAPEQNHHSNTPSFADNQSAGVSESDVEQERHKSIEAELQEEIKKLKDEKKIWLQKEACWEEKLKVLQHEVVSCIQIKTNLEEKIDDLQNGNASLTLKVSSLEGRVMKMEDIDESWQLKENVIKERLTSFVDANEDLQMQVRELRESREKLTEENKQLIESISMLESRVRHLETVETSLASTKIPEGEKSRAEAANASVKLDEQIGESDSEERALARPPDRVSANAIEDVGSMEQLRQIELMGLDDSRISEDVVSVPLDDVIQELQQSSVKIEPETALPLSDAPLIGAPFRLLSFVARFVSGADLVNQDKTTA